MKRPKSHASGLAIAHVTKQPRFDPSPGDLQVQSHAVAVQAWFFVRETDKAVRRKIVFMVIPTHELTIKTLGYKGGC